MINPIELASEFFEGAKTKWQIALDEIRRIRGAGVRFQDVLADAGYGACAQFRQELSAMQIT